jgi:lysophospholipid acyltransferase (LPLAT)-like uncharacterized protein
MFQKVAKNGRKAKAIALLFAHFLQLISFLKKWQKAKAIALTFRPFFATFWKMI